MFTPCNAIVVCVPAFTHLCECHRPPLLAFQCQPRMPFGSHTRAMWGAMLYTPVALNLLRWSPTRCRYFCWSVAVAFFGQAVVQGAYKMKFDELIKDTGARSPEWRANVIYTTPAYVSYYIGIGMHRIVQGSACPLYNAPSGPITAPFHLAPVLATRCFLWVHFTLRATAAMPLTFGGAYGCFPALLFVSMALGVTPCLLACPLRRPSRGSKYATGSG